MTSILLTALYC